MNQFPSAAEIRQAVKALGECRDRAERIAAQWPGLMLSRDEVDGRIEHKAWPWETNGLWSALASRLDDVLRGPCGVLLREGGHPPEDDASPFISELLVYARGHVSISTPEHRIDRPGSTLVFISARDPRATTTDLPDAAMHAIIWIERRIDRLEAAFSSLATASTAVVHAGKRSAVLARELSPTERNALLALDALLTGRSHRGSALTADVIARKSRGSDSDSFFRASLSRLVNLGLLVSARRQNRGSGYEITDEGREVVALLRGGSTAG